MANSKNTISQLCPACGMCCNGVLFGDVELQARDDVKRLASLGLDIFSKGRKQAFQQPCACFDGVYCRIYADRPVRCRTFECGQLKRVEAGRITTAEALKTIKSTRRQIETVRRILRELGQTDEHMPLNQRYAAVLAQPMDLAGDPRTLKRRGELMEAVGKLVVLLERDFLT